MLHPFIDAALFLLIYQSAHVCVCACVCSVAIGPFFC